MTVLLTGAGGKLGRAVHRELLRRDAAVRAVDLTGAATALDLREPDAAHAAARGCDALIHLAAHPSPEHLPGDRIFGDNTRVTFNVLEAAAQAGIRRAVLASSASAYGMAWAREPFSPRYVPLDEDHPLTPADPYGLSKQVGEQIAHMFHRSRGIAVVCLRLPHVVTPAELEGLRAKAAADPAGGARELWSYLGLEDAARACIQALDVHEGWHVVNLSAPRTTSELPTSELMARYHPGTEIRADLPDRASPLAADRAKALFGFAPAERSTS